MVGTDVFKRVKNPPAGRSPTGLPARQEVVIVSVDQLQPTQEQGLDFKNRTPLTSMKVKAPTKKRFYSPGATKTQFVVPVVRVVPVAGGAAGKTTIIVPRAAAPVYRPGPLCKRTSPSSLPRNR